MAETIGAAGIDRLLLGAAVAEPDRAEACWREFLAIQSVDDLWTADRQGLLPLIDTNLRDLPIDERPRLAGTRRKAWVLNRKSLLELDELAETLADAGVPMVVWGDLAIAARYPDIGVRPVDVSAALVSEPDAPAAVATLLARGWRSLEKMSSTDAINYRDSMLFSRAPRDRVRLVWEPFGGEALRYPARRSGLRIAHSDVAPTSADLLLHACATRFAVGRQTLLRSVADAWVLLRRLRVEPGHRWSDLVEDAAVLGVAPHLRRTLEDVEQALGEDLSELDLLSGVTGEVGFGGTGLRSRWARSTAGMSRAEQIATSVDFLRAEAGLESSAGLVVEIPKRLIRRAKVKVTSR